jgi:hypothetical protein
MIPSSRRLDGEERLALALLLGPQQAPHRARLHRHDADRVREHVVQFPRDPRSLLVDRAARLRLGALGPLPRLAHLLAAPRCDEGEEEDAGQRQGDPDDLRHRHTGAAEHHGPARHEDGRQRDRGPARLQQRPGRPAREEQGEEHRARVVGPARVDPGEEEHPGHRGEHGAERRDPPEEQRADDDQGQHGERPVRVVLVPPHLRLRRDQHREHDDVEDVVAGPQQDRAQHVETVLHAAPEPRRPR